MMFGLNYRRMLRKCIAKVNFNRTNRLSSSQEIVHITIVTKQFICCSLENQRLPGSWCAHLEVGKQWV